jgi:hypothetical protein
MTNQMECYKSKGKENSKLQCYKMKVLDDSGEIEPEFSLENVVQSCYDFLNEMSQLE